jgi:hypothetical protein
MREPIHVPIDGLKELQCHLTLDTVQVDERHPLQICLDRDVALVGVNNKVPGIHATGGIVRDTPDLGYDLQWYDVGNTSFSFSHMPSIRDRLHVHC